MTAAAQLLGLTLVGHVLLAAWVARDASEHDRPTVLWLGATLVAGVVAVAAYYYTGGDRHRRH